MHVFGVPSRATVMDSEESVELATHTGRLDALVRWFRWLPLLVFPVGCGIASIAIGQDITSDTEIYHYSNAWAFLNGRNLLDVFPGGFQTLLNPLEEVPPYLLATHLPPTTAAFIFGFWQGLSPLIVYLIARRVARSRVVAFSAAIAAAVAGGFASELGSMEGDASVAPFLLLGLLFAITAIQSRAVRSTEGSATHRSWLRRVEPVTWWWLAAGLCAGIGSGLKFAEASMTVGIVIGTLFIADTWRHRIHALIVSGVGAIVGVAATAGYWSIFLWQHFGDPFAFTGSKLFIFNSKYFIGTPFLPQRFRPPSFLIGLYYPVYWFIHPLQVAEIPIREASIPIAYLLAVALLGVTLIRGAKTLLGRRGRGGTDSAHTGLWDGDAGIDRYLVAMFVTSLIVWVVVFHVYRYLIPVELAAPVIIIAAGRRLAAAVEAVAPRLRISGRLLSEVFVGICLVCVLTESPSNYWLRIPFGPKEFQVATPKMLQNGKLNILVMEGANPSGFVLPELKGKFVAIGGIGWDLNPTMKARLQQAFSQVREDGGSVVGFWTVVPPPTDQAQYIGTLGFPGLKQQSCVKETLYVGAGYEPVGFCRYVPINSKGSAVPSRT